MMRINGAIFFAVTTCKHVAGNRRRTPTQKHAMIVSGINFVDAASYQLARKRAADASWGWTLLPIAMNK
jgi:hypothetical protein